MKDVGDEGDVEDENGDEGDEDEGGGQSNLLTFSLLDINPYRTRQRDSC